MQQFLDTALKICFLKKNPQDLPYGLHYPVVQVAFLVCLAAVVDSMVVLKMSTPVWKELLTILYNLSFVAFILWLLNYNQRFIQCISAVLSIDCLVNTIMAILIIIFFPQNLIFILILGSYITYCWRLTVMVNIFRETLETTTVSAVLTTVTYELFRIIIIVNIHQPPVN